MESTIIENPIIENPGLIKFNTTDAAIQMMRQEYNGLTITDKKSYDVVVKAIADVRTRRTDVEKTRKELKESALVWGRKVDAEAKRITALLVEIEDPLKAIKQAEDDKRMAVQREAERKEAERRDKIQGYISSIRETIPTVPAESSCLDKEIKVLKGMEITQDVFMEFTEEAEKVKQEILDRLNQMLQDRIKWEDEERQRKEELAKLEALRAENARLEQERKIKEAEERAAREAEERARRAEREKIEAEKRAIEAERARIEAEKRAEQERKEREERERLRQIKETEKARFEMLQDVGFTYPLDDLGTMSTLAFNQMYAEHKKVWDAEQNRLFLEKLERERKERAAAEEQARKEREEFERQAKIKAEQEAREKLEREEAERQVKLQAEEEKRKRQEALKPDKSKLLTMATEIENIEAPILIDEKAKKILADVNDLLNQVVEFISSEVAEL